MKILALDMSSTAIGMCYDGCDFRTLTLRSPDIAQRCLQAATQVRALITDADIDLVVVEAPVARYAAAVIAQSRVAGAVLAVLAVVGVAWKEISPASAKQALTGKGNAGKAAMIAAAALATGRDLDEHQADAYGLWRAALKEVRG